ncbi:MAG: aldo/keto reductase [Phycisphaeraceae bacterium]
MNQRTFNASEERVSEIGLGTWQLGGAEWGNVPEEEALATLHAAADAGVTFIDTADIYGLGRSEEIIGRFLAERPDRDRFFVATKLGRYPKPGGAENFTPRTIAEHTDESLRRLNVERLDLTQTHCIPPEVMQQGEVFETLANLKQQGKIRHWGASVESMDEALMCLEHEGLASLQIIFNIFRRKPIDVLFQKAQEKNVAIIVRLPLASGVLSGKMTPDTTFAANDHRSFNRDGAQFNVGETFAGLGFEKSVALAEKIQPLVPEGLTMAQMALRWCLDFDAVTTVIPGARRAEQVHANASASDLDPLSDELHAKLAELYESQVAEHIRGVY